ncbi:hypothetical protein Tco_1575720 [Tanacetum coccineum]
MVPYPVPAADLESEPFEDSASPVASDFNSVVPSFNFDLLSDRVSPTVSAASDDEPLGSPDTTGLLWRIRWSRHSFHQMTPHSSSPLLHEVFKSVAYSQTLPAA